VRKMRLIFCAGLLLSLMSLSCATEKIVYKDMPEGYTIVQKEVLQDMMNSCARAKTELLECLERERQRAK